jgi:hypothetical protein
MSPRDVSTVFVYIIIVFCINTTYELIFMRVVLVCRSDSLTWSRVHARGYTYCIHFYTFTQHLVHFVNLLLDFILFVK